MKKTDLNNIRKQLEKCRSDLWEREKELECVYNISRIVDSFSETERLIQEIVKIIPRSWQFPEIACCRAILNGRSYQTDNFMETKYRLRKKIAFSGETVGKIEIFYLEKPAGTGKNAFLRAEVSLLGVIAERIGKIYERKLYEKKLEDSYKKLQELHEHYQSINYEERRKIAVEVHDELGQAFTSLKIDLRWLSQRVDDKLQLNKIKEMEALVNETVKTVQQIARELRPVLLDDFGLSEAIIWYMGDIRKKTGIDVNLFLKGIEELTDKNISVLVYQIIKELATNTIRHAHAKKLDIRIMYSDKGVNIHFADNGIGIREDKIYDIKSFGIYNIRERIKYWGGSFEVRSNPGKETVFNISIPVPEGVEA